ncbi:MULTISPECIES: DUF4383 domain-containing protein [unclassified Curtobacterium]|uniref:DUF4383 domain-containing protein n=1 Tax=unclassified Curtobacterium TaxID=257496 RepID=UPI001404A830|nr:MULTISPECIES: DUF4383 domain-containing protein [unclassified Curtobacterium]
MRVTGIVLLGVVVAGLVVRLVTALRLGRSGSDTIPLSGRSNPGNQGPIGIVQRSVSPARSTPVAAQDVAPQEETDVAVKEPSIIASPNRALALTVGTLLAIWGILGFFFAGENGHAFFGDSGGLLWNAFLVNPALASVWTLLAAALFIVGLGNTVGSRNVNMLVGIVLVVLAVYGFVFVNTSANIFALNTTDNVFNAIVGVVLLLTALGADKQNIRALRAARA